MYDPIAKLLGEWASSMTVGSIFLRIGLALLVGAVLGCERAGKRHAAGLRTWITTQNHGYAVENGSMAGLAELSFWNTNDRSCEGLNYLGKRCFTVQFHPEACAGPHDTEFLFDRFLRMMRGEEA